jgi:hypothetical protein
MDYKPAPEKQKERIEKTDLAEKMISKKEKEQLQVGDEIETLRKKTF